MGIKDPCAKRQLRPRIEKMLYEIFRGRIAKQVVGNPGGLRKIRKWTLWRRQPPPKQKIVHVQGKSRVLWDHWPLQELQPPLLCVREREKNLHDCVGRESEKKKPLDDCDNRTDWKLIRKALRTSWS
jgi:hypothetical protein